MKVGFIFDQLWDRDVLSDKLAVKTNVAWRSRGHEGNNVLVQGFLKKSDKCRATEKFSQ